METSLLLLRVRGKQWYWVYKFELSNIISLVNTQSCVGHNIWTFSNKTDPATFYSYLHTLYSTYTNKFLAFYWDTVFLSNFCNHRFLAGGVINMHADVNFFNNSNKICDDFNSVGLDSAYNVLFLPKPISDTRAAQHMTPITVMRNGVLLRNDLLIRFTSRNNVFVGMKDVVLDFLRRYPRAYTISLEIFKDNNFQFIFPKLVVSDILSQNYFNYNEALYTLWTDAEGTNTEWKLNKNVCSLLDYSRWIENNLLIKYFFSQEVDRLQKWGLGKNKFNFNLTKLTSTSVSDSYLKEGSHSYTHVYWVMKQKRFEVKRQVNYDLTSLSNYRLAPVTSWHTMLWGDDKSFLFQIKQKRLLRTNRILLLPININITLITNSFDVIHSWYIPGLGIKLDCVPGRSTHHNLNIQNIGFYYGQCAEICGRYHHHMPIRICAVSFHQFIVWWSHFGIRKFTKPSNVVSNKFVF